MRLAVKKTELPLSAARSEGECGEFERNVAAKFAAHANAIHRRTDVMFAILMQLQWIGAIIGAGFVTPILGVDAEVSRIDMLIAVFGGGALAALSTGLAVLRPGKLYTRIVIGICQVLFSSLLLHLTNGQLGTAFHIFGSLAFLAAYRDWRVLGPPTFIVAVERFIRGHWWPHILYGMALSSQWRWLEVVAWVLFADIFLFIIIRQSVKEMYKLARHTAELEEARTSAEQSARDVIESHAKIRKLSLVASKARHPVIITNSVGDVEWANEALAELTEFRISELIGQKLWSMFNGARTDPAVVRCVEESLAKGQSVSTELIHYSKSGREHCISLEVDPVCDDNGVLTNFIATQADITERKRYEEQLRNASEGAEAANRAKSQFLANMSHEIRTPLNGILGFTEILLRGKSITEEERKDYLRTIASSGKHLLMLINDVLDLSKIEAGQLQVEHLECSPHQIIAEVISVLRVHAQEKGVGLEYRWESGIPETIQTDSHRLKQLLMNLVGNAVKFTQQGRVMVVAKLVSEENESKLSIEVRDTGIGIPTDKLATVFEPFVQADSSITRKHGGTGLGLAICRNIAEALGGQVWATSEMGVGSTFFVTITTGDLAGVKILEQPPQAAAGDVRRLNTDAIRLDGVNVLLVDDGDTNRRLIHILLSRHGANVVAAENGKIAVEKADKQSFDIVLMDMQMPVMDGYAATTRLRESGFTRPIIALTAHAMKGDLEKCEQAGCSGYLPKPIDVDALLRLIVEKVDKPSERKREFAVSCVEQAYPPSEAIRSLLPTDDPELRDVVREFLETLHVRLSEMKDASEKGELAKLAELAHWLKGAGGTVGFDCFTQPAGSLEQAAKSAETNGVTAAIRELQTLGSRVVV